MNIAVNTRLLLPDQLEGIGWFAHELLRRIVAHHPNSTFHFFFDRPYDEQFLFGPNVVPHVLQPPARHPILWYLWFEYSVTRKLNQLQPDLFFSPEAYLSLRSQVPTIMTVHDLSLLHYPQHVNWPIRQYVHYFYPKFVARANHIVTVSKYSQEDLVAHYPAAAEKVSVVYNGAREEYAPISEGEQQRIREQYSEGKPYFLYVGALQPRKNVDRLLQAFDRFKATTEAPHQLLIVGRKAWMTATIDEAYQQMVHKEAVQFLDYQPLAVVASLMGAAYALAYVSLFEGFGIPLLEALQCRVPVLTSNTTSMPEVAGRAGLCVDPTDVGAMAEGFTRLAMDKALHQTLTAETLPQASAFDWDQSAEKLWQLIENHAVH